MYSFQRQISSESLELLEISPIEKTIPVPPNAPIKMRKHFSKKDLKPKKLRFPDKERDEANTKNYYQGSVDYSPNIFNRKDVLKKTCAFKEELSGKSLSVMFENTHLVSNKENVRYEEERYVRKVWKSRPAIKKHANNDNSLQSSISSKLIHRNTKGEFVHLRI